MEKFPPSGNGEQIGLPKSLLKHKSKVVTYMYYKKLDNKEGSDTLLLIDDVASMWSDGNVISSTQKLESRSAFGLKDLPHYISEETKLQLSVPIELSSVTLPRAIFDRLNLTEHEEEKETMPDLELLVGRSAILLGVYMIFNEITSRV